MNYWPKHIGPWLKATVTLSAAEEGIYGRLCDWCYAQEQPLPLDMDEVLKITRARDRSERDATTAMLARFFIQTETGWRHQRVERELASARKRSVNTASKRADDALRQRNYRARRSVLFDQAQELGLQPSMFATNEQLIGLIVKAGADPRHGTPAQVTSDVTRDVTRDVAVMSPVMSPAKETENYSLQESRERTSPVTSRVMSRPEAGLACKRMRAAGMASVNPSDPRLHELLDAGVDIEEIAMAAAQAVARGKGFAYALAIAKGEHEAKQQQLAKLAEWAPGLLNKG